jgi:Tol biopolymer transport system component
MKRTVTPLAVAALAAAVLAGPTSAAPSTSVGLAYLTGNQTLQVGVAGPTGAGAHTVGMGGEPLLSPNGQLLAASTNSPNGPALLIYSTTSGTVLEKFLNINKQAGTPLSWSGDSRFLAVAVTDTTATRGLGTSHLAVLDTMTGTLTSIAPGMTEGASFNPSGARLVYAVVPSFKLGAPVNLFTVNADGTQNKQITHNGRSLNPVWGSQGIVFDRERLRGKSAAPAYQIYEMRGSRQVQITHTKPPPLQSGLVPMAVSADGTKLQAEFEGEDTSEAWTVDLSTKRAIQIKVGRQSVEGWGISRDGKRVLVSIGGFEAPPRAGMVATVPFGGGRPTVLVKHANNPSWNQ